MESKPSEEEINAFKTLLLKYDDRGNFKGFIAGELWNQFFRNNRRRNQTN